MSTTVIRNEIITKKKTNTFVQHITMLGDIDFLYCIYFKLKRYIN